jgi:hypothetical protein
MKTNQLNVLWWSINVQFILAAVITVIVLFNRFDYGWIYLFTLNTLVIGYDYYYFQETSSGRIKKPIQYGIISFIQTLVIFGAYIVYFIYFSNNNPIANNQVNLSIIILMIINHVTLLTNIVFLIVYLQNDGKKLEQLIKENTTTL